MAISLSNFLASSVLLLTTLVAAETHTYDFNIGWVSRNPDGQKDRPVIGINGEWPIPKIDVNIGDRLVVNVKNDLGNQSTSLHWHGLFQNGTNHMDGVAQGTQCQIAPGASFTYNFTVRWKRYLKSRFAPLTQYRSTNRELIGTTHTLVDSIQMDFEAL